MAMAAGEGFCHWSGHEPARVLVLDGEMPRELMQERLADVERRLGLCPETFYAVRKEDCEDLPPLDTPSGQAWLDGLIEYLGGIEFLILDNVMSLVGGDPTEIVGRLIIAADRLNTREAHADIEGFLAPRH